MRHLSINIELETPICYNHAIIQVIDEVRKKIGEKFNCDIYVSAMLYTTEHINAFSLTKIIHDLADIVAYSDNQVIKVKSNVRRSTSDVLCIDVFEMEQVNVDDCGN